MYFSMFYSKGNRGLSLTAAGVTQSQPTTVHLVSPSFKLNFKRFKIVLLSKLSNDMIISWAGLFKA